VDNTSECKRRRKNKQCLNFQAPHGETLRSRS
jgi:hypothetical protein